MSWKYILKERNPFMNRLEDSLKKLASAVGSMGIYVDTAKNLVSEYIMKLEGTDLLSVPQIEEYMLEALTRPINYFSEKLKDESFREEIQEIADIGELSVKEDESNPDMEQFKLSPKQLELVEKVGNEIMESAIEMARDKLYAMTAELEQEIRDRRKDLTEEDKEELDRVEVNERKVIKTLRGLIRDKRYKINYTLNVSQDMIKLEVLERMRFASRMTSKDDELYPIETDAFSQHFNAFTTKFPDYDWVGKSWSSHLRD